MWLQARKAQQVVDGLDVKARYLGVRSRVEPMFDYRIFGGEMTNLPMTAKRHKNSRLYEKFNGLSPEEFNEEIEVIGRMLGRQIPYQPPRR